MDIFSKRYFDYDDFVLAINALKQNLGSFNAFNKGLSSNEREALKRLVDYEWVRYTKEGWVVVRIEGNNQLYTTEELVTREVVFRNLNKSIKDHLSIYPEEIQAIVVNALPFSTYAKDSWCRIDRFNTLSDRDLSLLTLIDYRFLAALLYNAHKQRYTVGVKDKIDSYIYSSAPVYDGTNYVRVRKTIPIVKALISFQNATFPKPLEYFINASAHN